MLNIPESVKALFMTDGVRKNFRAHFPNGELPDITNADLDRESVSFTESMCSQDVFRFGLSEASVVEFETVGVPNMYGMVIECAFEVDTSSLSAAEISAIQAGSWDGTLVLPAASDLGFGYFQVPLGVFRVESCPRNHEAMAHRQVTAYSYPNTSNLGLSPVQDSIFSQIQQQRSNVTVDAFTFVAAQLGYYSRTFIDAHYTRTPLSMTLIPYSETVNILVGGGFVGRISIEITGKRASNLGTVDKADIRGVDDGGLDYAALCQWIDQNVPGPTWDEASIQRAKDKLGVRYADPENNAPKIKGSWYCFYPYYIGTLYAWYFPTEITVRYQRSVQGVWTDIATHTETAAGTPAVYEFSPIGSEPSAEISVDLGALFFPDLLSGYLELRGVYGKVDRMGGLEISALDPSAPIEVGAGDYESCWWDEYDVSPVGTVLVAASDGSEVSIGSGTSVYDMTNNEVIQNMINGNLSSLSVLLRADFSANVANIGFTPVDLNMHGWPWLEAGDALEITAADGSVVNTYALRLEMSGIQMLSAAVTAEGGEIMEG